MPNETPNPKKQYDFENLSEKNIDDIPDDLLLNDDFDDDPLMAEMSGLLGTAAPKVKANVINTNKSSSKKDTTINPRGKQKTTIQKKAVSKTNPTLHQSKAKDLAFTKAMIKDFTLFMLKKAKIYDEISYYTIIRKLPPKLRLSEERLIDLLEKIIEKGGLQAKLTATAVKYYYNRDRKK